jgi:hypothetical protein
MTMATEATAEIIPPPRRRAPTIEQAPLSDSAALLSAIEKAALNPQVDIGKVEQLLALYERIEGRRAEAAFNEALTAAQAAMRPVATDMENGQTRSRYASYAALDRVLRPIYTNAGFSLTFNTAPGAPEAYVRVTCNVAHRAGHVRTYTLDLPADGKGAKGGDTMSRTHATASALSYGMRYLLRLIFNIAVGEGDDDGNKAGAQQQTQQGAISAEQLAQLRKLIAEAKADTARFCRYMKVARLEDLPAARFQAATAALEAKRLREAQSQESKKAKGGA